MANSVDPDHTPHSASTLFAQAYLSKNLFTVCEQERSRSANKATESDEGYSNINMDIFYRKKKQTKKTTTKKKKQKKKKKKKKKNAPVSGQRRPH